MYFRTADGSGALMLFDTPFLSGFTTRRGGVSGNGFASFNLYFGRGDEQSNVKKNFEIFRSKTAYSGPMVFVSQVHGAGVYHLEEAPAQDITIPGYDGIMTSLKGVLCSVKFADCLPLLIYGKTYASIVHCGWRGCAKHVQRTAVRMMKERGEDAADLKAVMGPHIGEEHYEVGPEVRTAFLENGFAKEIFSRRSGKDFLSLERAVRKDLAGCDIENVISVGEDTFSKDELYYSYRRDGRACGEMMMFFIL